MTYQNVGLTVKLKVHFSWMINSFYSNFKMVIEYLGDTDLRRHDGSFEGFDTLIKNYKELKNNDL